MRQLDGKAAVQNAEAYQSVNADFQIYADPKYHSVNTHSAMAYRTQRSASEIRLSNGTTLRKYLRGAWRDLLPPTATKCRRTMGIRLNMDGDTAGQGWPT